jgi:peptide/nickel transport system permease protein
LRHSFGLDQPAIVQLVDYLIQVMRLNLGFSFYYNKPVLDLIIERLMPTLLLMSTSAVISLTLGVICGVAAATRRNTIIDDIISVIALLAYATPLFWIGLLLILLFSVGLGWFPTGGMVDVTRESGGLRHAVDVAHHLVLPSLTLSSVYFAIYTRLVRASMLEVAGMDYVRTAYAKGLKRRKVLVRHILRNALLPIATMIGMQAAALLSGAVLVETVFAWPGLGRLTYDAVFQRDYPLLTGILILTSLVVVTVNTLVDIVYSLLDPRISVR